MFGIVLNKDLIDSADGNALELDCCAIIETIHGSFKVDDVSRNLAERIAATKGEDQSRCEDHRA